MTSRKYRIRVRAGWEHIPEFSEEGSPWEPLNKGMMGGPIGYASEVEALSKINNEKHIRSIPDRIIEVPQ